MPDFPQEPYPNFEVRCWALMLDKSKSYLSIVSSSETKFCQEDQIWNDEEWKEWMGNLGIEVGYCWEVSSTQNSSAACCVQNLCM